MHFCYFIIISPWERAWPFIWINLNPLHPKMLSAKFGWNWPSGSGGEDFKISLMHFAFHNVIISPWKRVWPFTLFTQGCFESSMDEIGPAVLEKKKKMWKCDGNDDNNNEDGQQTYCDQKSSLEHSAHLS